MIVNVVDASVAVAWFLEEEDEPDSASPLLALREHQSVVPQLWHVEIRNALVVAHRRGRITIDQIAEQLDYANTLPIDTDNDPDFDVAMHLAVAHNLTFYDALYLELALRRNIALATLDRALARAARSEGVPLTV